MLGEAKQCSERHKSAKDYALEVGVRNYMTFPEADVQSLGHID